MTFAHPRMLWLLACTVALLGLFFWWSWRKRNFLISQFVQSRLLAHLTVGLSNSIQKARMLLLVLATALIVLTLARPQWGFAWEEVHQSGLDIVVAIDTSRSMLAEDIAPNRLERAKLASLDLMKLARRDRLGLVAFAGTAFLQCPLTLDDEAFRQSLNQLNVGIIPQGGTALAEAIQTAQTAFKENGDNFRVLILFTDGEDHDSGAVQAAERAAREGLRIFTVGVGTANGELLRQRDEQGNLEYVKDPEGNVVKSRLNETLLTQIATAASGFYVPLSGSGTVDVLYQRGLAPLPKSDTSTKLIRQYHERYQWPLAGAILLLLAEVFLPDRKRVRRSEAILAASNPELRKLVAVLAAGSFTLQAQASTSSAQRKYDAGQFKDAYQEYRQLLEKKPEDVRLQYNAGTAAYQAKKFEDATKHFSAALKAPDLALQEHAFYNLGNAYFRTGEAEAELEKKQLAWEQSVKEYEAALKLDPKDADAAFNLELVKKRLEELKQQQQKQQSKDNSKDQDKDKDKDKDQKQDSDKKDQDKKQEQQKPKDPSQPKDSDQKQPDQKPSPDQNKPENQPRPDQPEKKDQPERNQDQPKPESAKSNPGSETNRTDAAAEARPGQMTPEQVQQLLDSQKNNEKVMIFIPPEKQNSRKRVFKDW